MTSGQLHRHSMGLLTDFFAADDGLRDGATASVAGARDVEGTGEHEDLLIPVFHWGRPVCDSPRPEVARR